MRFQRKPLVRGVFLVSRTISPRPAITALTRGFCLQQPRPPSGVLVETPGQQHLPDFVAFVAFLLRDASGGLDPSPPRCRPTCSTGRADALPGMDLWVDQGFLTKPLIRWGFRRDVAPDGGKGLRPGGGSCRWWGLAPWRALDAGSGGGCALWTSTGPWQHPGSRSATMLTRALQQGWRRPAVYRPRRLLLVRHPPQGQPTPSRTRYTSAPSALEARRAGCMDPQ